MDWRSFLRENAVGLGVVLVGALMVGLGVWHAMTGNERTPELTPVESEVDAQEPVVIVEIAGAVTKPGVYEVESGTRLVDLIELAEGLTDTADTEWVAKTLNQAERLKDGQKVYIPTRQEASGNVKSQNSNVKIEDSSQVSGVGTINVNTASQAELEELWGVGEARAKAIIESRPYATLEELNTKAKIPDNVLERNEGKLSLF